MRTYKYLCLSFILSLLFFVANGQEINDANEKIFFSEIKSNGGEDIGSWDYIYDFKTQIKKELISKNLVNIFNGIPKISYDKKYLSYFIKKNGKQFICLLNLQKDVVELNVEVPMLSGELNVSTNLNYMTFYRNIEFYNRNMKEIYLLNINSKEILRLTNNNVPDFNPIFSPSEKMLLYLEENSSKTILKSYNISNKETSDIIVFSGTGYQLFQYLDEERVLLKSKENRGTPFILNLKSGTIQKLDLDRILDIAISPDGKRMVYLRAQGFDDPTWNLFIADINGKIINKIPYSINIDIMGPQWVKY